MRRTMKCGRCDTRVKLYGRSVTCTSCNLSHDLEIAMAQISLQAKALGHTFDPASVRADTRGTLTFQVTAWPDKRTA